MKNLKCNRPLGRHLWTIWREMFQVETREDAGSFGESRTVREVRQNRECVICGKIESRRVFRGNQESEVGDE